MVKNRISKQQVPFVVIPDAPEYKKIEHPANRRIARLEAQARDRKEQATPYLLVYSGGGRVIAGMRVYRDDLVDVESFLLLLDDKLKYIKERKARL